MKYLLDTHYMLWAIMDSKRISKKLKNVITDPENEIIISSISFWEISLKSALGKLHLQNINPQDLPELCEKMAFSIEPLHASVCSSYHQLSATYHKDPFDRMLIWTAITNNYTLVTADEVVIKYKSEGLKIYAGK
jgi:PIN domain nuclease of toxin-antitoxin system